MAHRKVLSEGSVPFSWEEKPGIPKLPFQCSIVKNTGINANALPIQKFSPAHSESVVPWNVKISPPPCAAEDSRRRSSFKGIKQRQDDPFTAAIKECTKTVKNYGLPCQAKKSIDIGRTKKLSFSCKKSCDVKDNNLVRLPKPNLPPLPREKINGRAK